MTVSTSNPHPASAIDRYVLDNAAPQTPERFSALEELYDASTISHLEKIGVGRGWRCWEIGAGPGSIAQWLCRKVGPDGAVLATDIDTRFLESGRPGNLEVRRHDIVADTLPVELFDLVHARLVLVHLPAREAVLDRMIAALKPGGWLLTEEFTYPSLLTRPDHGRGEVTLKSSLVLRQVMMDRGVDPGFGRSLAVHLRARGLQRLSAEGRALIAGAGSAGARLLKANLTQLREPILASGMVTPEEFAADIACLDDEDFLSPLPVMWSVSGMRPTATNR